MIQTIQKLTPILRSIYICFSLSGIYFGKRKRWYLPPALNHRKHCYAGWLRWTQFGWLLHQLWLFYAVFQQVYYLVYGMKVLHEYQLLSPADRQRTIHFLGQLRPITMLSMHLYQITMQLDQLVFGWFFVRSGQSLLRQLNRRLFRSIYGDGRPICANLSTLISTLLVGQLFALYLFHLKVNFNEDELGMRKVLQLLLYWHKIVYFNSVHMLYLFMVAQSICAINSKIRSVQNFEGTLFQLDRYRCWVTNFHDVQARFYRTISCPLLFRESFFVALLLFNILYSILQRQPDSFLRTPRYDLLYTVLINLAIFLSTDRLANQYRLLTIKLNQNLNRPASSVDVSISHSSTIDRQSLQIQLFLLNCSQINARFVHIECSIRILDFFRLHLFILEFAIILYQTEFM